MSKISDMVADRLEAQMGASFEHMRAIGRVSTSLFVRYANVSWAMERAARNAIAPKDAYHAARIRGAQAADCGSCVQIEVNLATKAGLAPDLIRAILNGEVTPESPLAAVCAWTDATMGERVDDTEHREIVQAHYGQKAMIEISYAMNAAAFYPGVKRALGYAVACQIPQVDVPGLAAPAT